MKTRQSVFKILVCDDDQADRKLVRAYLQQINDREIVLLEAGKRKSITPEEFDFLVKPTLPDQRS